MLSLLLILNGNLILFVVMLIEFNIDTVSPTSAPMRFDEKKVSTSTEISKQQFSNY